MLLRHVPLAFLQSLFSQCSSGSLPPNRLLSEKKAAEPCTDPPLQTTVLLKCIVLVHHGCTVLMLTSKQDKPLHAVATVSTMQNSEHLAISITW